MINMDIKYKELIDLLNKEKPFEPEIALILGSGLGDFADRVNKIKSISTADLPNYPKSTVQGHQGFIHFAEYEGKKLIVFQGRIHLYEGYSISACVLPVFIANRLGATHLLLTNAAGGMNPDFVPGDLMLITSVNSITIKKDMTDLLGIASLKEKNSMLNFPSKSFNQVIKEASLKEEVFLKEGVYWVGKGPSYETPAEVKMLSKFGTDAVGMSTAHEAIFGTVLGMEVSAISCITNFAAGISPNKLNHQEVMETAEIVKSKFEKLVKRIVTMIQ